MQNPTMTIEGFFFRWIGAIALVLGTYNPSEFCFIAWMQRATTYELPFVILTGVFLAIGYMIVLRATMRSLGSVGVALLAVFFAAAIWSLVNLGLIDLHQHSAILYLALISIATILAIGMSWSFIRAGLSGQVDVNE